MDAAFFIVAGVIIGILWLEFSFCKEDDMCDEPNSRVPHFFFITANSHTNVYVFRRGDAPIHLLPVLSRQVARKQLSLFNAVRVMDSVSQMFGVPTDESDQFIFDLFDRVHREEKMLMDAACRGMK